MCVLVYICVCIYSDLTLDTTYLLNYYVYSQSVHYVGALEHAYVSSGMNCHNYNTKVCYSITNNIVINRDMHSSESIL